MSDKVMLRCRENYGPYKRGEEYELDAVEPKFRDTGIFVRVAVKVPDAVQAAPTAPVEKE